MLTLIRNRLTRYAVTLLVRNRMTGRGSDVTNKEQNDRERQ